MYINQNRKILYMYTCILTSFLFLFFLLCCFNICFFKSLKCYQRFLYKHFCADVQLNNIKLFLNTYMYIKVQDLENDPNPTNLRNKSFNICLMTKEKQEGYRKQSINMMFSLLFFNDSPRILHLHHLNQRCLLSIHWKTNNSNILVRFFSNSRNLNLHVFCLHMV